MLNKILEVFTKEYKDETEYREYIAKTLQCYKLKNKSENVAYKIERLTNRNYESNFKVKIGEY